MQLELDPDLKKKHLDLMEIIIVKMQIIITIIIM